MCKWLGPSLYAQHLRSHSHFGPSQHAAQRPLCFLSLFIYFQVPMKKQIYCCFKRKKTGKSRLFASALWSCFCTTGKLLTLAIRRGSLSILFTSSFAIAFQYYWYRILLPGWPFLQEKCLFIFLLLVWNDLKLPRRMASGLALFCTAAHQLGRRSDSWFDARREGCVIYLLSVK